MIGPVEVLSPNVGTLELQKYCAEDLDVVNAAKVSFAGYSESMGAHETGLLGFLLRNDHMSPFEHNFFKFRVRAPIAVAREWVRHRIGTSWNEESGRYTVLRPDFYVPSPENVRSQVGKPGSYSFDQIKDPDLIVRGQEAMEGTYEFCWDTYNFLKDDLGWAKELARFVLPVGMYTEWIWSCNARSLMHFCTLRNAPDAQLEIRVYAQAIEDIFAQIMPVTYTWFRDVDIVEANSTKK